MGFQSSGLTVCGMGGAVAELQGRGGVWNGGGGRRGGWMGTQHNHRLKRHILAGTCPHPGYQHPFLPLSSTLIPHLTSSFPSPLRTPAFVSLSFPYTHIYNFYLGEGITLNPLLLPKLMGRGQGCMDRHLSLPIPLLCVVGKFFLNKRPTEDVSCTSLPPCFCLHSCFLLECPPNSV